MSSRSQRAPPNQRGHIKMSAPEVRVGHDIHQPSHGTPTVFVRGQQTRRSTRKIFAQNASGLFRLDLPISGMTGMTRCLETSQALTTTCRAPANSKLRKRPARIGFSSFLSFLLLLLLVGLLGEMSAEDVGASGPPSASEHQ